MLPMTVARSYSGKVTKSQGERAILWDFFPIDNALYSIAFGTHTTTAQPIEMPFGLMARMGPKYHVLDGDPIPKGKGQFLEKKAAHCEVMGHSTVRCTKTAEPIDMPFLMKTRVGPCNHILDGGADPPRERSNYFRRLPGPFKHIGNLGCTGRCRVPTKGIIQSPITSYTAKGSFRMPGKCKLYSENFGREWGGGIAQRGRNLIFTIALLDVWLFHWPGSSIVVFDHNVCLHSYLVRIWHH